MPARKTSAKSEGVEVRSLTKHFDRYTREQDHVFEIEDEVSRNGLVPNLQIQLPERLGGGSIPTRITGTFAISFFQADAFAILGLDTRISSFEVPGAGKGPPLRTGRLRVALAPDFESGYRESNAPPLNTGIVQRSSGAVRISLGARVQSRELLRRHIPPARLYLQQSGFLDAASGRLVLSGNGVMIGGSCAGMTFFVGMSCRKFAAVRVVFLDETVQAGRTIQASVTCTPPAAVSLMASLRREVSVGVAVTPATLATGNGRVSVTVPARTRTGTKLVIQADSPDDSDEDIATVA
ncbi:MAG: hypothetical protein OZ929_03625 [Bryobacterales bacterium]|nr:hypothetical protein [Bryobacterales bacterium]